MFLVLVSIFFSSMPPNRAVVLRNLTDKLYHRWTRRINIFDLDKVITHPFAASLTV